MSMSTVSLALGLKPDEPSNLIPFESILKIK